MIIMTTWLWLFYRSSVVFDGKRDDSTQFMITVKQTGLVGNFTDNIDILNLV